MKNFLKKIVIGTPLETFARRAYATVTGGNLYDQQTTEVMKRVLRPDSNAVDVGCHEGVILLEILEAAPKGLHFAFEPIPQMYQSLVKKFSQNSHVRVFDCALSDADGTTTFQHVVSNPAYSGLQQRRYDRPDEEIQEITVTKRRLDDIIPADVPIAFIKIDVEGAEVQVLRGAVDTIKRCKPVLVFEHGLGGADFYGTGPNDVYELLVKQAGLRLFLMEDWIKSNGKDSLTEAAFSEHFFSGRHYYFMAAP